ncbi:MAG: glycosyltransferase family 4 protein, partial [Nitrososphaera sp.]|nr:glycosyltransferase family 4 protein [Nitrososphaera sp.]
MTHRILFIAPSAYTLGGVQTWLDYLLPGLRDRGWEVTLGLVSGRLHDVDRYLAFHPFAPVERVEAPTGTREGRVRAIMKTVKRNRPDLVVVVNVVDAYEAVQRVRIKLNASIKLIATLHGLQPDFLEDFSRVRSVLDAVICTNHLACNLVEGYSSLPHEKIFYAPYGVDVPARRAAKIENTGKLHLGYAGRFETYQKRILDIPLILKSGLAEGLDLTLSIAGGGPEASEFDRMIREEGLTGRVTSFGTMGMATLRSQIYQRCDILLLTSSWETGPIVAWEALSEGLPLLTSDYLGRRSEGSLIDQVNCCVFPVGNIGAAVRCLHMLLNADLRNHLAVSGRRLVLSRYTKCRSVDCWSKCFETVHGLPHVASERVHFPSSSAGRLDKYLGISRGET